MRANAELYQQGALADRALVDEAMRRIVLESRRMSVLVDDMLRLARLDQHPGKQHELLDLTALLTDCVDQAKIADPRRSWQADIARDLTVTGDAEQLRRAVTNLLANVRTHTPRGATRSSRPGAGLGLAIVAATATAHDGNAEATLNCPHGLTVTVALPSAPS